MTERLEQQQVFAEENGWGESDIFPLPSDASFRSYTRLVKGGESRLLMDAPPAKENLAAYLTVQAHLVKLGLRPPSVYATDIDKGLALIEDFGAETFTRLLAGGADALPLYLLATDVLAHLYKVGGGPDLDVPAYDTTIYLREVDLFVDWFIPAVYGRDVTDTERAEWHTVWQTALADISTVRDSLVLRDYHVDNLMILEGEKGVAACGLLDFQDALIGSKAYDLVSLVEDARIDVSADLRAAVIEHYLAECGGVSRAELERDMALLGAQRHAKVAGIFVRLSRRDGKDIYLKHIPRVLKLLERALQHEALSAVRTCIEKLAPEYLKKSAGLLSPKR